MAGEFVPFLSGARSRLTGAVAGGASSFSAMGNSSASVAVGDSPNSRASSQTHPHSKEDVTIELKRSGEKITQIRIQCCCGEVIELDCEY